MSYEFNPNVAFKIKTKEGVLLGYRYNYYDALYLAGEEGLIEPINVDTEFNNKNEEENEE